MEPTENKDPQKSKPRLIKILKYLALVLLFLFIGAVFFIKFDTAAAAQFTDSVLRPMLGADRVLYLEKIFFNSEDKLKQIQDANKSYTSPLLDQASSTSNLNTNLDLTSIPVNNIFKSINNESVWLNKSLSLFPNQEVVAETFTRPDPARPYAIVTLVKMDMSVMRIGSVAGTIYPAGQDLGRPGPGVIPNDILKSNNLVAAFNIMMVNMG